MPQSILKQSSDLPNGVSKPSENERIRATAIHHATLIQERKDIEAQILSDLEVLLELPTSSNANPSCPSDVDAEAAAAHLRLFQPANFDELIAERNICNKCGYILCPNPNQKQDTNATYRILSTSKKAVHETNIVRTRDLEKWCSEECATKARRLRAQLNEEPAWARSASKENDISIVRTQNSKDEAAIARSMEKLCLESTKPLSDHVALAIERGDTSLANNINKQITVSQHTLSSVMSSYDSSDQSSAYNIKEGYKPNC